MRTLGKEAAMGRDFFVNAAAALAAIALATAACGLSGWEIQVQGHVIQSAQPDTPSRGMNKTAQGLVERR